MMVKDFSLSILILCFPMHGLLAQNLVPNGGFDDQGACSSAITWYNPATGVTTPDFFHTCKSSGCGLGVPTNKMGRNIAAAGGNGYAGMLTHYSIGGWEDGRECLQVALTEPLKAGQDYLVRFYTARAPGSRYASLIGAHFSNGVMPQNGKLAYNLTPHLEISSAYADTSWLLVSDTYTASGGEDHLTIGNFRVDANSDVQDVGNYYNDCGLLFGNTAAYYFVDEVSVTALFSDSCKDLTDSGTAYASQEHSGAIPNLATYAFDDDTVITGWANDGAIPAWLEYDFGKNTTINAYRLYCSPEQSNGWTGEAFNPGSWQFQGYNSITNSWQSLDVITNAGLTEKEWKEFTFANTTSFTRYRFNFTSSEGGGNFVRLTEVELFECDLNTADSITVTGDTWLCSGNPITLTALSSNGLYFWESMVNPGTVIATDSVLVVSPGNTTTYRVHNNSDTAYHTVTVFATPVVNLSATYFVCLGETITLSLSGQDSYMWNTGATNASIQVSPVNSTSYTVTFSKSGCTNSDETVVHILATPVQVVGDTICEGDTAKITAIGAGSFQWNTGQFSSVIAVMPTTSVTYSVTITLTGCTESGEGSVIVNPVPSATVDEEISLCFGQTDTLQVSGGNTYAWNTGDTTSQLIVSPGATTIYTFTITDATGCSDGDSVIVTIFPPVNAHAGNDTALCGGDRLTLTALGGSYYQWNTGDTNAILTIRPTTTTMFTVTATSENGCSDTAGVMVTVFLKPTIDLSEDTTVCHGHTVTLTATGGERYLWSTGATTSSLIVASTVSDTLRVIAFTDEECSDTGLVTVTVLEPVWANAGPDTAVCPGNLVAITAGGGINYIWNTGSILPTVLLNPVMTKKYTVTVLNAEGCSSADTVTVTVWPDPEVSAGKDTSACLNDTIRLAATGGVFYTWNTGASSSVIDPVVLATVTYSVSAVDINGCTGSGELVVTAANLPQVSLTPLPDVCQAANAFVLTAGVPAGGEYAGTGITANQFDPSIAGVGPHLITYTYKNDKGCSNAASDTLRVITGPPLWLKDASLCRGDSLVLIAGPDPGSYVWNDGNTNTTRTIAPTATTTYSVSVSLGNNCTARKEILVTLHDIPFVDIQVAEKSGCAPFAVTFVDNSLPDGVVQQWDFMDAYGSHHVQNTINQVAEYTYTTPGTFDVSLSIEDKYGCKNLKVFEDFITVHKKPWAQMSYSPYQPSTAERQVTFNSLQNENVQLWYWGFGDDSSKTIPAAGSQQEIHTYFGAGNYDVMLIVRDKNGCSDTVVKTVTLVKEQHIYVPSAFSPNGDGHNDRFGPQGTDVGEDGYDFYVFSRWGEEIFHGNAVHEHWDGTHWGMPVPDDVYNWLVYYTDSSGQRKKLHGVVSLLK